MIFENTLESAVAIKRGRYCSNTPVIICTFIIGMLAAPCEVSWFITGPLAMITGRKKISRKKPFKRIFPFNIIAIISANATITGTASAVCNR